MLSCELIGRLFLGATRVKSLQDFTSYQIAARGVVVVVVVGCYCYCRCMVPAGVHYRDHEITTAANTAIYNIIYIYIIIITRFAHITHTAIIAQKIN